ncbi:GNAT family N-acetyltransferase [Legionella sp.]|uniref:GNAT family N-acetyltransferase n=1 Tax=Legionella sp. TaxID=459 RepID=UPI003CC119E2
MFNITNQLNDRQFKELEQLKTISKKTDGNIPNLYTHLLIQPRHLSTIFLYYEKEQLIGFLSIYFFYDDAVEVSLLIHPQWRHRGIAKQLLQNIIPLVLEKNYFKLIFSSPSSLNDHWLPGFGFSYQHSEYSMERHILNPLLDYKKQLTFRRATIEDIPQLCMLDKACFNKSPDELEQRFQHILNERDYQIELAFEKNYLIGKAHLRWQKHGATLSDIAVFPDKQGQGLGTALITHCVNYALSEGKSDLNLDVETHNQKALDLYTRLGFLMQNACDYWQIEINQLLKWLEN